MDATAQGGYISRNLYLGEGRRRKAIIKGEGIKRRYFKKANKFIITYGGPKARMGALPNEFVLSSHKSYEMGAIPYILQTRKLRLS